MTSPIDYTSALNGPGPADSFLQGFQGFNAVRQAGLQAQQQEQALAQQQRLQADLAKLAQNPTPAAIAQMSIQHPQLSEQFKRSHDMLTADQQQGRLSAAIPIYAAVQNGRMDVASQMLRDRSTALKNSGQDQEAQQLGAMADLVEQHPENAKVTMGTLMSSIMGPEKFATTFSTLGQEGRAQELQPDVLAKGKQDLVTGAWNNANTRSQIEERAARLHLDRDRLTSETQARVLELNQKFGQLPDDARKLVNDSALTAVSSEQQVQQYQQLAGQIDQLGSSWGAGTGAHEWLKRTVGSEDAVSALKREYTRMASQGVIKLLPPGPASDKDIENAKGGIPPANASPEVMASYLRGMSKLSAYDAVLNNAKAEWAGAVQHLGRAKQDIEIDGVKVPAGTTFNDFARKYISTKADALNTSAALSSRGYLKYAQPPAAAPAAAPAAPLPYGD